MYFIQPFTAILGAGCALGICFFIGLGCFVAWRALLGYLTNGDQSNP